MAQAAASYVRKMSLIRERSDQSDPDWVAGAKAKAHQDADAFSDEPLDKHWSKIEAQWHSAAAAIRPAIYHAARHRIARLVL